MKLGISPEDGRKKVGFAYVSDASSLSVPDAIEALPATEIDIETFPSTRFNDLSAPLTRSTR